MFVCFLHIYVSEINHWSVKYKIQICLTADIPNFTSRIQVKWALFIWAHIFLASTVAFGVIPRTLSADPPPPPILAQQLRRTDYTQCHCYSPHPVPWLYAQTNTNTYLTNSSQNPIRLLFNSVKKTVLSLFVTANKSSIQNVTGGKIKGRACLIDVSSVRRGVWGQSLGRKI